MAWLVMLLALALGLVGGAFAALTPRLVAAELGLAAAAWAPAAWWLAAALGAGIGGVGARSGRGQMRLLAGGLLVACAAGLAAAKLADPGGPCGAVTALLLIAAFAAGAAASLLADRSGRTRALPLALLAAAASVPLVSLLLLPSQGAVLTLGGAALLALAGTALAWLAETRVPPAGRPSQPGPGAGRLVAGAVAGFAAAALLQAWTRVPPGGSRWPALAASLLLLGLAAGIAGGAALTGPRIVAFGLFLAAVLQPAALLPAWSGPAVAGAALLLSGLGVGPMLASRADRGQVPLAVLMAGAAAGALAPLVAPHLAVLSWLLLVGGALSVAALLVATRASGRVLAAGVATVLVAGGLLLPPRWLGERALENSLTARITVSRSAEGASVLLDGATVAEEPGRSRRGAQLLGHLAMLLHPQPLDVLQVGLGTGALSQALLLYPIGSLTIVEPTPGLIRAIPAVFPAGVAQTLSDPRVSLRAGLPDAAVPARSRFDAIVLDPPPPQLELGARLLSRESFALVRRHLNPPGLVAVSLRMDELDAASLIAVLRAFWEVFPSSAIFYDPLEANEFLVLVGRAEAPGPVTVRWTDVFNPALTPALEELSIFSPYHLAAMLLLAPDAMARMVDLVHPNSILWPELPAAAADRSNWLESFRILWAFRTRRVGAPIEGISADEWLGIARERDARIAAQIRALGLELRD